MDLINISDSKYDDYESLLLERDQLNKEGEQIWTVYLQIFGQMITEHYEEMLECIKCKKIIAYCQSILNHGGTIDINKMQEHLDAEMLEFYNTLQKMLADYLNARNADVSTEYDVKRAKELYRKLAKLIHPDLNPVTDSSEQLKELWQRIMIAYRRNDVKELSELEVLVRKVLNDLGLANTKAEIPNISEKIEELKKEIEEIKHSEPYCLKYLIENEEAIKKKKR